MAFFYETQVFKTRVTCETQVSKQWYSLEYFENNGILPNILPNYDIWPFWPSCVIEGTVEALINTKDFGNSWNCGD